MNEYLNQNEIPLNAQFWVFVLIGRILMNASLDHWKVIPFFWNASSSFIIFLKQFFPHEEVFMLTGHRETLKHIEQIDSNKRFWIFMYGKCELTEIPKTVGLFAKSVQFSNYNILNQIVAFDFRHPLDPPPKNLNLERDAIKAKSIQAYKFATKENVEWPEYFEINQKELFRSTSSLCYYIHNYETEFNFLFVNNKISLDVFLNRYICWCSNNRRPVVHHDAEKFQWSLEQMNLIQTGDYIIYFPFKDLWKLWENKEAKEGFYFNWIPEELLMDIEEIFKK